jgi:cytochrome c oxidase subunit 3
LFAAQNVKAGKSGTSLLLGTLLLGILFSFSQIQGWGDLVAQGVYLTGEGSNASGSFIYAITLMHLLHLIGGLIALTITTIKSKIGKYTKDNYLGIQLVSIYWHFLGLLWLYLFLFFTYS